MSRKTLHHKLGIFAAIPVRLLQDRRLGLPALKVYAALASFEGLKESAYPGIESIAARAGVARSSVSVATKQLSDFGWLRVTRRGQGATNLYECLSFSDSAARSRKSRSWRKGARGQFQKSDNPEHRISVVSDDRSTGLSDAKRPVEKAERENPPSYLPQREVARSSARQPTRAVSPSLLVQEDIRALAPDTEAAG